MPTSLFQYEMLPTTWFYLSSLLIFAVFGRFNRILSVRNLDVLTLVLLSPGLVYVAMGSAFQGYLWLLVFGAFLFLRLAFDVFLLRRPLMTPNMNFMGLAFSCIAASAFMIPNLFMNRGDACESPRAWRLEQILAAADEADPGRSQISNWPGYPPFLQATADVDRFFAPSQIAWSRAVADMRMRKRLSSDVDFFGFSIKEDSARKKRPAARAVRWASGASDEHDFEFDSATNSRDLEQEGESSLYPESLNGVRAALVLPNAPVAPSVVDADFSGATDQPAFEGFSTDEPNALADADERESSDSEFLSMGDSASFRWQPLSQEGALIVLCVICLQIGVVVTMILIGRVHFGSVQTGCAAALLYLLLPYINQFSARLDHIAPALLILLAVLLYRRPFLAGMALGIAGSLVFYPFLLLPLWIAFYWKKGLGRFLTGSTAVVLTMAVVLLFIRDPDLPYGDALESMFGNHSLLLRRSDDVWEYLPRFYRIPIISIFGVFCFGYAFFVPQKNLATLTSCSAALMLGVQFWMGRQGGLYMAWYLPLAILTAFRPNLSDRTAVASVVDF